MAAVRYFDDLEIGQSETSPRRTITEADVVAFSGLSGDFNPLHTDRLHAAETRFGKRIAQGLLGTSIAAGLFTATELSRSLQPALIALLEVNARYLAPIFFGDTIWVEAEVTALERGSSGKSGVVTIERVVRNQDEAEVQRIVTPLLVKVR
jgi:3-hydroxybutyryl-CoA dehydratase